MVEVPDIDVIQEWRKELADREFYSADADPGGTRMLRRMLSRLPDDAVIVSRSEWERLRGD